MPGIDIHTHAFHPKIASKAVRALEKTYGVHCLGSGLLPDLEEEEVRAGVSYFTVLCAATAPSQVLPANNYAIKIHQDEGNRAIAFGTLHPGYEHWEEELDRLEKNGIRGLKLHPDFQGFSMNDPALLPIYEACEGRFIVLFHVGSTALPSEAPSSPIKLRKVLQNFPRLDVIAGHFGGYRMWDLALQVFSEHPYEHLWMDTSSTTDFVDQKCLHRLFTLLPEEHYFFGTDWPIYRPGEEMLRLKKLAGFSDERMERLITNASFLLSQYGMLPNQSH